MLLLRRVIIHRDAVIEGDEALTGLGREVVDILAVNGVQIKHQVSIGLVRCAAGADQILHQQERAQAAVGFREEGAVRKFLIVEEETAVIHISTLHRYEALWQSRFCDAGVEVVRPGKEGVCPLLGNAVGLQGSGHLLLGGGVCEVGIEDRGSLR